MEHHYLLINTEVIANHLLLRETKGLTWCVRVFPWDGLLRDGITKGFEQLFDFSYGLPFFPPKGTVQILLQICQPEMFSFVIKGGLPQNGIYVL